MAIAIKHTNVVRFTGLNRAWYVAVEDVVMDTYTGGDLEGRLGNVVQKSPSPGGDDGAVTYVTAHQHTAQLAAERVERLIAKGEPFEKYAIWERSVSGIWNAGEPDFESNSLAWTMDQSYKLALGRITHTVIGFTWDSQGKHIQIISF